MTPDEFHQQYPDLFILDPSDAAGLGRYLVGHRLIDPGEGPLRVGRAGEGNMNCTVRVSTPRRSLIVKQSRPWVEKYPQFAAPWDRAVREMEFYRLVSPVPEVARHMPRLRFADPAARVLVLEDLGEGGDYTHVYRGGAFTFVELRSLATWLGALHRIPCDEAPPGLANREMRALNHAHIFVIPLDPANGLDLDAICPGLTPGARALQADSELRTLVGQLGREAYLADGPCLLHGDFFPGSLIRSADGPRVIDPEFGFPGRPEFDVAVLSAHLLLAHQPPALLAEFLTCYARPTGFDELRLRQLTGVEILRRLIGYAQLPLTADLRRRLELLELARELVRRPDGPESGRRFAALAART